jgi:hypothetical protein
MGQAKSKALRRLVEASERTGKNSTSLHACNKITFSSSKTHCINHYYELENLEKEK